MVRSIGIIAEEAPADGFGSSLADFARQLWWERRLRTRYFPAEIFAEPAWDLLLHVYAASKAGTPIRLSKSHLSACVPPYLAGKRARHLIRIGILTGTTVKPGGRIVELRLAPRAEAKLESLLKEMWFHRGPPEPAPDRDDWAPRAERLRRMAEFLTTCRDELDAFEAWEAAAHLSQALGALEREPSDSG